MSLQQCENVPVTVHRDFVTISPWCRQPWAEHCITEVKRSEAKCIYSQIKTLLCFLLNTLLKIVTSCFCPLCSFPTENNTGIDSYRHLLCITELCWGPCCSFSFKDVMWLHFQHEAAKKQNNYFRNSRLLLKDVRPHQLLLCTVFTSTALYVTNTVIC